MIHPVCISLQLSDLSSQEIITLCESLPIQTPPQFNCFFHTSILQFYTQLDLLSIKRILADSHLFQAPNKILEDIALWDANFKSVRNMSLSIYDNVNYALMFNYDCDMVLLDFAQQLLSMLQEFIIANEFNAFTTDSFNSSLSFDDSRFPHVFDFPRKVQSGIFNPHTTAGFVTNSDLAMLNNTDNLLSGMRISNLRHTKLVLSELTNLCMTPFSNSLEVWEIQ